MKRTKSNKKPLLVDTQNEREKNNFLDIISHHLRTPIAGVRWSLDALKNGRLGKLTTEQSEAVVAAYQHNLYLAKVVNDMLRVRSLDEHGVTLHSSLTPVSPIIRSVVERYKPFIAAHNGTVEIHEAHPIKAYIDRDKFEWIITALVHNAITYSRGVCKVTITISRRGVWAVITVRDQGIGISQRNLSKVFSKFFRTANARKIHPEGLGLDLYVVRQLIEAFGGSVVVQSKEEKYTEFVLLVPVTRVEPEVTTSTATTEEMLRKQRQFVAVTIHELREPLATTKWSLDALKTGRPGPITTEQRQLIDQMYAGTDRMLMLVSDMLNLAKLQEGSFSVVQKPCQIDQVINNAIRNLSLGTRENGISVAYSQKPLPMVNGDQVRLSQVVTNLLSNAIKYSKRGGTVTVKAIKVNGSVLQRTAAQSGATVINSNHSAGYVLLTVSDTGIGMSKADYHKVFTPFFRSKRALSSSTGGTGLGLYIVKSIVDMHGGDIWFTSTLGRGTTFFCSIPVAGST